jgi:hypothetical protein
MTVLPPVTRTDTAYHHRDTKQSDPSSLSQRDDETTMSWCSAELLELDRSDVSGMHMHMQSLQSEQMRGGWRVSETYTAAAEVLESTAAQLSQASAGLAQERLPRRHVGAATHAGINHRAAGADTAAKAEGEPGRLGRGRGVVRCGLLDGERGCVGVSEVSHAVSMLNISRPRTRTSTR